MCLGVALCFALIALEDLAGWLRAREKARSRPGERRRRR
jgi:hypothetical protein